MLALSGCLAAETRTAAGGSRLALQQHGSRCHSPAGPNPSTTSRTLSMLSAASWRRRTALPSRPLAEARRTTQSIDRVGRSMASTTSSCVVHARAHRLLCCCCTSHTRRFALHRRAGRIHCSSSLCVGCSLSAWMVKLCAFKQASWRSGARCAHPASCSSSSSRLPSTAAMAYIHTNPASQSR